MSDEQDSNASQLGKLIRVYIKMRDRLKEMEAEKEELEEKMKQVKIALLDNCNEIGANSLNTPFGRVTRTLKTRYWTTDWNSMYQFMRDNDAVELLERRIRSEVQSRGVVVTAVFDLALPGGYGLGYRVTSTHS